MTVPSTSATSPTASSIGSLDVFARQLYRRARTAGCDFADIATVVRGLHTVLKHLRVEAEDPDSLLNTSPTGDNRNSLYARQLAPILEDCDFTLKQLETVLQKYGGGDDSADDSDTSPTDGGRTRNGRRTKEVEEREKDMTALIRTKLANQKTNIDIFLDTVQLHNPVKARGALHNADEEQLDAIKDQVDEIATRLFHRRGAVGGEDDEQLWQQFSTELERAGFSSEVLRNNKEVLRAYIRELDSHDVPVNGAPPSVRGLLVNGSTPHQAASPMRITPASYSDLEAVSPKESFHRFDNEKFSPDVKNARPVPPPPLDPRVPQSLQPYHNRSQPPALYSQRSSRLSYEPPRSDASDTDSQSSQEMAVISTRDLIAMDHRAAELVVSRMGGMHLGPPPPHPPPNYSYSPGSNNRYLPSAPQPLPITAGETPPALVPGHPLSSSPGAHPPLASSPRYVPPYTPDHPTAAPPPPSYGTSPTTAITIPQRYSRLAPDSKGQEIPLDAKWTRIRRALVSPVVLEKAGVRYEARPEFVAVLGVVGRERIESWARESAEVRNARARGGGSRDRRQERHRERGRGKEARGETYGDYERRRRRGREASESSSESELWDESDTTQDESERKGRRRGRKEEGGHGRVVPVIVSPPRHREDQKLSPTSVGPKPILKNRNRNHVRFDDDGPREIGSVETSRSRDGDRRQRRDRDHERGMDRDRERDRDRPRRDDNRDRERERDRDRDHDRDHHHRNHHRDRDRDRERDGKHRNRDLDYAREEREAKKSARRETLKAVGIGGAAASLLSVLTEAASGL